MERLSFLVLYYNMKTPMHIRVNDCMVSTVEISAPVPTTPGAVPETSVESNRIFFNTLCNRTEDCLASHNDSECEVRDEGSTDLYCSCKENWKPSDMTGSAPAGDCRKCQEIWLISTWL